MQYIARMQLLYGLADISENECDLLIIQTTSPASVVKERALRSVFDEQMDEVSFAEDLKKLNNVGVCQGLLNGDFLFDIPQFFRF